MQINEVPSPFEFIRRQNEEGLEYWYGSELSGVLGYLDCKEFKRVIQKAKYECKANGHPIAEHFTTVTSKGKLEDNTTNYSSDILLSRYACYLIIHNANADNKLLKNADIYFACRTVLNE